MRYKSQRFDNSEETWKDKNQIMTALGYKEKIGDLTLKAKYKYVYRHYTENPEETNAVKKSLSAGFEYRF